MELDVCGDLELSPERVHQVLCITVVIGILE